MPNRDLMHYEIVKRIFIQEDTVCFVAADSDLRPLRYTYREEPVLTDIFRREGLRSLMAELARDVYQGRLHLRAGSLITRALRRGLHALGLERFHSMEEDAAVAWLSEQAEKVMLDWEHDPASELPNL